MIEHGIVEASSYTPSRVLSPTLHTVGDFVEVCYHGEKEDTASSLNSQTQAPAPPSSMSASSSKQNDSTSADWKNVEDLLVTSSTSSDALTFIPCESGSVGTESDIVLSEKSPLSSGDTSVKYGDESPGVHSTHSKTGITLSGTASLPLSSKAEIVNSSTAIESEANKASTQATTVVTGKLM